MSLACPGKEGHVAGVLWARERDGTEVREVGRAGCMKCQGTGSSSGFFPLELSRSESQSLKIGS